jgi:hypothetical protein
MVKKIIRMCTIILDEKKYIGIIRSVVNYKWVVSSVGRATGF